MNAIINHNISLKPRHFGFLIMPRFSLTAYATAIDTLKLANETEGKTLYSWETITPNNMTVKASSGLKVEPDRLSQEDHNYDVLIVCGGLNIRKAWDECKTLDQYLNAHEHKGVAFGALYTGSYILAKAKLLDGYRCTIHWENISALRYEFPNIIVTENIYEIDRNRYTCAGGTTSIDMINHFTFLVEGWCMSDEINDEFLNYNSRDIGHRQRSSLRPDVGAKQPKLKEAVMLMESNIEEYLSPTELANYVSLSKRQLERLFKLHLNCTPMQYYLRLRLINAKRLLSQTDRSVSKIALSCGFNSSAYFSKAYKDFFEISPKKQRKLMLS